jgi:hypothetical protein
VAHHEDLFEPRHQFVVCLGYEGYVIKEYFANYYLHSYDVTFYVKENNMKVPKADIEPMDGNPSRDRR